MKIKTLTPRLDWPQKCEQMGFYYHSIDGRYWCDDYYYELSRKEANILERAGNELHSMYLSTVADIIQKGDYQDFGFSPQMIQAIESSWREKDSHINSVYSRFDLSFTDEKMPPKLLEYNADTPTTLLESSIVQKQWLNDVFPGNAQFNSINEDLIARWKKWAENKPLAQKVFFTSLHFVDDEANTIYMMDAAMQAGLQGEFIFIEDMKYSESDNLFLDAKGEVIEYCYKLYPWEWLEKDDCFEKIKDNNITFIEPAWKLLLSNKAILVHLWKKYRNHPNLLPTYFSMEEYAKHETHIDTVVKKHIFSREGWNIQIIKSGEVLEESLGVYSGPSVYQEYHALPFMQERYTPTGLWMIGDKASGVGFRDDSVKITQDTSWFAPHVIVE